MRLLLDTHYFLWLVSEPERVLARLIADIERDGTEAFISTICVWEIAIKHALGRLRFPIPTIHDTIAAAGFVPLPITHTHAITAGALPRLHHDPFDRMLVAQAQVERLVLVSADRAIRQYGVTLYGGGPG